MAGSGNSSLSYVNGVLTEVRYQNERNSEFLQWKSDACINEDVDDDNHGNHSTDCTNDELAKCNINCLKNSAVVNDRSSFDDKTIYVCSIEYVKAADKLPKIPQRSSMVHSLIHSYKLLEKLRMIKPIEATDSDLRAHHSADYLDLLKIPSYELSNSNVCEEYGLGYDCPVLESTYDFVKLTAGATITAAEMLVNRTAHRAINWGGGWHHAKRDQASGFCYVNDIVLGILKLRKAFNRILYVDLDLHHGDGVEEAFEYTPRVMTVSFHMFEPGFFPGTGSVTDVGAGKGRYYSINVPLKSGIRDDRYVEIFIRVMGKVYMSFNPDVIVCQCGADCLAGDPMSGFNLTPKALGKCIQFLKTWKIPMLFLGGGGYHLANTARCWTYLTAVILGVDLDSSIPDNYYFMNYKPGFELDVTPGYHPDNNTDEYVNIMISLISDYLSYLK